MFGLTAGRLVPATCDGFAPGDFREHGAGLLAGAAVLIVVAEENLGGRSAGSAVLGHVIRTDVDGGSGWLLHHLDGRSIRVSAAYTVGLTFGGLNHEGDAAVVSEGLVQFEGEGLALAHDGGRGRILYAQKRRRHEDRRAAAGDDPVIEPEEQVGTGDLPLGAKNGTGLLRKGQFVPREDVRVGKRLPHGRKTLENSLDLGLVGSPDTAAVPAVADVLAVLL